MAERGLPAPKIPPMPKAVRAKRDQAKTTYQARARGPPQKTLQNRNLLSRILH